MSLEHCPKCGHDLSDKETDSQRPDFFYKYCALYDFDQFEKSLNIDGSHTEFSITNLFNCQQRFSSRTTFNDVFDTQIYIVPPTKIDFKKIRKNYSNSQWRHNHLRDLSKMDLSQFIKIVNEIWDNYHIYCFTQSCTNNLMWGHYANCHKGFCIEWDAQKFGEVFKIEYVKRMPKFELIDFFESTASEQHKASFKKKIESYFKVKLDQWQYEEEFRIITDHNRNTEGFTDYGNFSLFKFKPTWIQSVIFGAKTDPRFEKYIIKNIPYDVDFKKTHINYEKGTIEIKPYR